MKTKKKIKMNFILKIMKWKIILKENNKLLFLNEKNNMI